MPLWEELATLVTVMLLGHWGEMRSIFQAQGALKELAKLLPAAAVRVVDGREEEVPLSVRQDGNAHARRAPGGRRPHGGVTEEEALRMAAAVERDSEHSVAQAVVRTAEERGLAIPLATSFAAIPGQGVRATVEGRERMVGGPNLLRRLGATLPTELQAFADERATQGQAAIYLVDSGRAIAALAVADAVRPEAHEAIRRLHGMGIGVEMRRATLARSRTPSRGSSGSRPSTRRSSPTGRRRRSRRCSGAASGSRWSGTA